MSRLARKPIKISEGTEVIIDGGLVTVKSQKGELKRLFRTDIVNIEVKEGNIFLNPSKESRANEAKIFLGTYASHLKNMVEGVLNGFEKKLIIEGIGYKAELRDNEIVFSLGFSHPVNFKIPKDITVSIDKNTVSIKGIDKEKVGLTASKIRMLKKPEPYKGKGIRYANEVILRKAGKKTA